MRLRRIVSIAVLLSLIGSTVFSFINTPEVQAAPGWLANYTYRKAITINGSPDGSQTDYQLPLLVRYGAGNDSMGGDFFWSVATAFNDPSTAWSNEGNSYDQSTLTNANTTAGVGATSWSAYLEYTIPTTHVDGVRFWVTNAAADATLGFNVDVLTTSGWTTAFSATNNAPSARWVEIYFTQYELAAYATSNVRVRVYNPNVGASVCNIFECQFRRLPVVHCNSTIQADFDDIRFTTADGLTLISHWTEWYTASTNAMVWVKFPVIPKHPQSVTYFMYYGNGAAVSGSSGTNTFIAFDDFEAGVVGNPVGGIWTVVAGTVVYDNTGAGGFDLADTYPQYGGTKSMKLQGGAAAPTAYISLTLSNNVAWRYWAYKEDAATQSSFAGTASNIFDVYVRTTEAIWVSRNSVNTGYTSIADTFQQFDIRNINIVNNTHDVFFGDQTMSIVSNNCNALAGVGSPNQLYFSNAGAAGVDTWIDNLVVYKWTERSPHIGRFSNQMRRAHVSTGYIKGRNENWAIMSGSIDDVMAAATVSQRGFDWGTSRTLLDSSWTEAGAWTAATTFSYVNTQLAKGTLYYYRAKIYDGTAWSYGEIKEFNTGAYPQQYSDWGNDNLSTAIGGANWASQLFTVTDIANSITQIDLMLIRTGTPGTVTVSIRDASGGLPGIVDLVIATLNTDNTISTTTPTWYSLPIAEEYHLEYGKTYAIIIRALAGNTATDYVRWAMDAGGKIDNGNLQYSTDGGASWTQQIIPDTMFKIWGNTSIDIQKGSIYTGYLATGDWMITGRYKNFTAPYYIDGSDVKELFNLRLVSVDGLNTLAQVAVPEWGYRPGSIYLSAATVTPLTWGSQYRLRIFNQADNTYQEYPLFVDSWIGNNLTQLDSWVLSTATLLENHYGVTLTTYIADKGRCLNNQGSSVFLSGCPSLNTCRPNLFAATTSYPTQPDNNFGKGYQATLIWQTQVGATLTSILTDIGATVSLDGKIVGMAIMFLIFMLIAIFGFASGHAIAAMFVAFPVILAGTWFGFIDLVVMFALVAVVVFVFVWKFILSGG